MKEKGNLTFFASLSLLSPLLGDLFVLDLDLDLKRMMNIKWDKETHLDPVNLKYELGRKKRGNHFDLDLDFDLLLWLRDLDFDFEVFFPLRLRDLNAEKEEQGGFKRVTETQLWEIFLSNQNLDLDLESLLLDLERDLDLRDLDLERRERDLWENEA